MQITRKQIIDHLNHHHTATAVELSRALNVTAANIRHHISELIQEEIIEEVGNLPTKGRGRPTKLYCLSKRALHHNLDFLIDTLLQVLSESASSYEQVYHQIAGKMLGNLDLPANLVQRLNQAMAWLNHHNYRPRWEASPSGPRAILGYCPYVAILDTNPEMCAIDAALLSQLLGLPMQQIVKLERSPQGTHHCIFAVHK